MPPFWAATPTPVGKKEAKDKGPVINRRQSLNLPRETPKNFEATFDKVVEEEPKTHVTQPNTSAHRAPDNEVEQLKMDYEDRIADLRRQNAKYERDLVYLDQQVARLAKQLADASKKNDERTAMLNDKHRAYLMDLKDRLEMEKEKALYEMKKQLELTNAKRDEEMKLLRSEHEAEMQKRRQSVDSAAKEHRMLINKFQAESMTMRKMHETDKEKLIRDYEDTLLKAREESAAREAQLQKDMKALQSKLVQELQRLQDLHGKNLEELRAAHNDAEEKTHQAAMEAVKADETANSAAIVNLETKHQEQLADSKRKHKTELDDIIMRFKKKEEELFIQMESEKKQHRAKIEALEGFYKKKEAETNKTINDLRETMSRNNHLLRSNSADNVEKIKVLNAKREADAHEAASKSQQEIQSLKSEYENRIAMLNNEHQKELKDVQLKAEITEKGLHQKYDAEQKQQSQKHTEATEQEARRRAVAMEKDINTLHDQHKKDLEALSKQHQAKLARAQEEVDVMRVAQSRLKSQHDVNVVKLKEDHQVELARVANGPGGLKELKQEHENLVTKLKDELRHVYSRVDQLQRDSLEAREAYGGNLKMIIQLSNRLKEVEKTLFEKEKLHRDELYDRDTQIERLRTLLERLNTATAKKTSDAGS